MASATSSAQCLLRDLRQSSATIRDGSSHCVKILSEFYDNLDTSDPNDPDVIIKIDVSNAFITTDRYFTLDMISHCDQRTWIAGLHMWHQGGGCYSHC